MQILAATLAGLARPCAPKDCPQCAGAQRLHGHGRYERNADCHGKERIAVPRFQCPRCEATFSVLPQGWFPYRALKVERFEAWMDTQCRAGPGGEEPFALADGEPRPPPACEAERGCLLRARKSLLHRTGVLCAILGQRLPVEAGREPAGFWRALRAIGRLGNILAELAVNFKTSLLWDYRSLLPHWQRVRASG